MGGLGHDINYSATNKSSSHELYDADDDDHDDDDDDDHDDHDDDDDPSQSGQTMGFDRNYTMP